MSNPQNNYPEIGSAVMASKPFNSQLLQRIRNGITGSSNGNNPVELPPWLPPQSVTGGINTRVNATTYALSSMIVNAAGTHQFIVTQAGTTAGAEPATVTNPIVTTDPYNMGFITDGTASLAWAGPVRTTTPLPGAPSVSVSTLPAQLTTSVRAAPNLASVPLGPNMRGVGGTGYITGTTNTFQAYCRGASTTAAGTPNTQVKGIGTTPYLNCTWDSYIEFMTDASLLALDFQDNGAAGLQTTMITTIEIDGRRMQDGAMVPQTNTSAGAGYIILDWRSTGPRKWRKIRVATFGPSGGGAIYADVRTTPADTVSFPYNPNRYRVAWNGDSLAAGSNNGPSTQRWDLPSLWGDLVGCDDVSNIGVLGTGFIGNASGLQLTYIQRIPDLQLLNPDILVIAGAFNDIAFTSAARQQAMLAYLQAVRKALPNLMIIMQGTFGGTSPTNNTAVETDQQLAVQNFNDPNCFFVPIQLDTPAWFTGTGSLTGTTGTGNNDIYIGPLDAIHPSIQGIVYAASKAANAFKNLIASLV
jgi:hypothetical protein